LDHQVPAPYAATFVARRPPAPHLADSTLLITRRRYVGNGMVEEISVGNYGRESAAVDLALVIGCDFAGLFEVKEGRIGPRPDIARSAEDGALLLLHDDGNESRGIRVSGDGGAVLSGDALRWQLVVDPHEVRTVAVEVTLLIDGVAVTPRFVPGAAVEDSQPAERLAAWRAATPSISCADERLAPVLTRSVESLGALRIFHPSDPERTVIAAGAPWFMTLFGRDALLTSWMMLPLDPSLALGTARTLAELQGRRVNPLSEEQPGRILHELRSGPAHEFSLGHGNIYYGSADATPLFAMLVGEMHRWGIDPHRLDALLPHVWRALEWTEAFGDVDGDGFVEYQRATDRGLRNQGWKDSFDAINDRTGRLIDPPIALAEVQGYVYAAYLAGARLAAYAGEPDRARHYERRAGEVRRRFNEAFWLPQRGYFAVAIDADKRPVDALTSNIGHCLWTGIIDPEHAAAVAAHLTGPAMFTGFGVRTLAADMGAYNPVSYHNGSVWPHDTAIVASGLMRYGFIEEAQRLITGLFAAAQHFGGILPELFCGFDRAEFATPVPYPTSCFPQAWAAAAPLLALRTLLRFEPDVPAGVVHCAPALPADLRPLRVDGLELGGSTLTIDIPAGQRWELKGLPPGLRLIKAPAPP
jgi:glycogen debranching enzyme